MKGLWKVVDFGLLTPISTASGDAGCGENPIPNRISLGIWRCLGVWHEAANAEMNRPNAEKGFAFFVLFQKSMLRRVNSSVK